MSEDYLDNNQENLENKKRPVLLTVLCILSFIIIGIGLMGVLFSLLGGQPSDEEITATYNASLDVASGMRDRQIVWMAELIEQSADIAVYQQRRFWSTLLMNFVTFGTGFMGVLFMLKGKKLGFHLYIIYNLISVGGAYILLPSHMIPMSSVIMNLIFSGLFVFLYSRNLKWMTK
ncbi:hypothetical protein [Fluviicola taffensis]|uniref:Uncharacterized protein n=1 Tax=Fluviicola taffensis (strain DSM 16823 / NCIMB 13979 / RW262) TaxID=755732 RepID=F2IG60_FLUTR|nr:hypothetical protein [Fluviicola taffensis]AEA44695.1 hypothetical protein Fluta_2714 [Fluviicola taffensis DSM 16823]